MSKIFQKNRGPAVDVKRNTFDLSYANHLTSKIGKLVPVYCEEVLPGDSFRIRPSFGLRFNPLLYPIQSRYHGIMHFFYVRNRNLMVHWDDYVFRNDSDIVAPYLRLGENMAEKQFGTGSLGDYLGIPSTVTGDFALQYYLRLKSFLPATNPLQDISQAGSSTSASITSFQDSPLGAINRLAPSYFVNILSDSTTAINNMSALLGQYRLDGRGVKVSNSVRWNPAPYTNNISTYGYWSETCVTDLLSDTNIIFDNPTNLGSSNFTLSNGAFFAVAVGDTLTTNLQDSLLRALIPISLQYNATSKKLVVTTLRNGGLADIVNPFVGSQSVYVGIFFTPSGSSVQTNPTILPTDTSNFKSVGIGVIAEMQRLVNRDATSPSALPFHPYVVHDGQTEPKTRVSALPFRAYESIYNYFYREETTDPLIIDGKPVYNEFLRTREQGADSNLYELYEKNWELDYFTSCQSSPQQGIAPLVGISADGTFKFDDGTTSYEAHMTIGDDGETITGISTYSPNLPKGSLRQLMDVVTNGISINDLRNVNSFQRWLETNMRRGYKYVEQVYAHFGVTPSFQANDMPEFIGGVHSIGDVMPVVNQSAQGLGQYGANITLFGNSENDIYKYCDEHGYIIGVMCVFPEPIYSQMLPKHFLKTSSPLDYFSPEFGHIGMQPITYQEVCPLEVAASDYANNTDNLNKVFGYQRAWAEYLSHNDEIHGQFRTSMSEYVVSRVFHDKPELGHDFIAINEDDINDVFVTTDDGDKIKGQVRFEVSAQRPIPEYGIPRLE